MRRHLLSLWDLSSREIHELIARAEVMKRQWKEGTFEPRRKGSVLGLFFTKPSTRTRVSFEAAMYRLGGQCVFTTSQDSQVCRGEALSDMARVLSRYVDALVVRTYAQEEIEELAAHADIPVINGLTDSYHPCQVLSDLLTVREKRGSLEDLHSVWVGDGNNMAHSWMNAAAILGFTLTVSCPVGYEPDRAVLEKARKGNGKILMEPDPRKAVAAADFINTDVWASMGKEDEAEERREAFQPYRVNGELLGAAPPHALVLHCLPAHRGEEIAGEVLDGPRCAAFDQAENRLHLQMALLDWLLET